jgi:hypothetical protein
VQIKSAFFVVGVMACGSTPPVEPGQPDAAQEPDAPVAHDAQAIDHAPVLVAPMTLTQDAGYRIAGQLEATDADGDPITFAISPPSSGAIELGIATGAFTYVSTTDFAGSLLLEASATANGVTVTAPLTIELRAVAFLGEWSASSVKHFDGETSWTCDPLVLPLTAGTLAEHVRVDLDLHCTADQRELFSGHVAELEIGARQPGRFDAGSGTTTLEIIPGDEPGNYRLAQTSGAKTWTMKLTR